jgi:cobalamin-dependent methionine synthase I
MLSILHRCSGRKVRRGGKNDRPDIVALSTLLTTTMLEMKVVIDALIQAGLHSQTKIVIGGVPVTQEYADEIGADGYGQNASSAVTIVRSLLRKYKKWISSIKLLISKKEAVKMRLRQFLRGSIQPIF